jgi:rhodanese-related sulfurtransferase
MNIKEITPIEMQEWKSLSKEFQLIDVREAHEIEIANIGGTHIPMGEVPSRTEELRKDIPVIIHCRSGARSGAICSFLETLGFSNVYNLKGGILAYAKEIDPSLPVS